MAANIFNNMVLRDLIAIHYLSEIKSSSFIRYVEFLYFFRILSNALQTSLYILFYEHLFRLMSFYISKNINGHTVEFVVSCHTMVYKS